MPALSKPAPSIGNIAFGVLISMNLSARLLQLRKQRDWTQQELADAVGIHVNQVRRYEAGSAQPSLDVLKNLARAFAVSTDSLLFDEDERQPPDDLRLQFEALRDFSAEERAVARAVIESLILRHSANRFNPPPSAPAPAPAQEAS